MANWWQLGTLCCAGWAMEVASASPCLFCPLEPQPWQREPRARWLLTAFTSVHLSREGEAPPPFQKSVQGLDGL